jgi:hypothetical protein
MYKAIATFYSTFPKSKRLTLHELKDIPRTTTVGELYELLENYDEDCEIKGIIKDMKLTLYVGDDVIYSDNVKAGR